MSRRSNTQKNKSKRTADRDEEEKWLVLFCEEDDSHSLYLESDVICEPPVKLGQEVQFFYQRKLPWVGVVKAMGCNRDAMNDKVNELNAAKPKRSSSFHADQPRKTAQACKQSIADMCGSRQLRKSKDTQKEPEKNNNNAQPSNPKPPPPKLSKNDDKLSWSSGDEDSTASNSNGDVAVHNYGDVSDVNDSDSSSSEELTPEIHAALQKLAQKRKSSELQQLLDMSSKKSRPLAEKISKHGKSDGQVGGKDTSASVSPNSSPGSNSDSATQSNDSSAQKSDLTPHKSTVQELDPESGSQPDEMPRVPPTPSVSNAHQLSKSRGRYRPKYLKKKFEGQYFVYKSTDPNVIKVHDKRDVYINKDELNDIKKRCMSATDVARKLVTKVFTAEAIKACSVTGRPAAGRGKEAALLRPPLDSNGVDAIYECANARAVKKKWRTPTRADIHKAIADVLCEIRCTAQMQQELDAKETQDNEDHPAEPQQM